MWQLRETGLDVTGRAQKSCKFLRLIEIWEPSNIFHEFVKEKLTLLNEATFSVAHSFLFRDGWDVQTHKPSEEHISKHVELLVTAVHFKLAQMITSLDLVQVMLANRVILHLSLYHVNLRGLVLSSGHKIFEGGDHRGDENGLLLSAWIELLCRGTLHHHPATHAILTLIWIVNRLLLLLLLSSREHYWILWCIHGPKYLKTYLLTDFDYRGSGFESPS
jgi:hypothetical protein